MPIQPLGPNDLYTACDTSQLGFARSDEVSDADEILGQDRALHALRFGANIQRPGYNVFVLGPPGTGKNTAVHLVLEEKADASPVPDDWAYVNNFTTPHQPRALRLPAGRGRQLQSAMRALIDDIRTAIPAAFEADDYQSRRQAIDEEFQQRQQEAFDALRRKAEARDIALVRTPMGFALAPIKDGKILGPEDFNKLSAEEQQRIQEDSHTLEEELQEIIRQVPRLNKDRHPMRFMWAVVR